MSHRREKPDADEIRAILRELRTDRDLSADQRRWSQFIFHYSDVRNVANILKAGCIFSRQQMKARGLESVEIAQLAIIEQSPWAHPYARLYFRPATPTQYSIEGIRASGDIIRAHCPIPVFLLFDSERLLTREGCLFSNTNLARTLDAEIGDTAKFMRRYLNFGEIYHDAPLSDGATKRRIIGARCAEVLFKDALDLQELREIVCRTPGERATLLTLLGDDADRWRKMVRVVYPAERMFFRDHVYVQDARLLADGILVEIGGRVTTRHTYTAGVRLANGERLNYGGSLPGPRMLLRLPASQERAGLHVELCGCLAYRGVLTRGGGLLAQP